jgi:tetratricopeptide (TPR) repeat protein
VPSCESTIDSAFSSNALAGVFDPSREQLEVLRRAVNLAAAHHDEDAMARAEYWAGYIYYALGESGQALAHLEVALERAQRVGDVPLVTQIRATLGQTCAAACEYDRAIVLLDGAAAAKRRRTGSNRPAVGFAYTLACKASVLGDRGLFEQAYQFFDEALAAIHGSGHEVEGSVLCWQSGVFLWQGRWDDARCSALAAQRVAERVKSRYLYARSVSQGAYATWKMQGSAESLRLLVEATSWLESRQRVLCISLNYGWIAEGMVALKEWCEARRYAARALKRGRRHDLFGEAMAYRAMAHASAVGKNRTPPEQYLALAMNNALARGSPHDVAVTQLCDAEIRLARGQRAQAATLLDRAGSAFDAMAMAWHLDLTQILRRRL